MSANLDHRFVDIDEDSPQKQFTVKNRGAKPLRILSVSSADANEVFSYSPQLTSLVGTIIEPDGSVVIQNSVRIKKAGEFVDTVTIIAEGLSDDPDPDRASTWSGSGNLSVFAYGTDAVMEVYKKSGSVKLLVSSINFGKMTYGSPQTMRLYISKKSGKYPLQVSNVSISNLSPLGWTSTASLAGVVSDFSRVPCTISTIGNVVAYDFTFSSVIPSANYGAEIRITSNSGGTTQDFVIPVDGNMEAGNLKIYPYGSAETSDYTGFARVLDNTVSEYADFVLENTGGYPLTITDLRLASSSGGATYSRTSSQQRYILTTTLTVPFTINPYSSKAVRVSTSNPGDSSSSESFTTQIVYLYVNGTGGSFPKTQKITAYFDT